MSRSDSHQSSYAIHPNELSPDHQIRQRQDAYFNPRLLSFDPLVRPFDRSIDQNDMCGYPYGGGVVYANHSYPVDASEYPHVNEPSASYQPVPPLQDATPSPKWTLFVPGAGANPDMVIPLMPSDDSIRFVCGLHDSGVHRWTLSSDVDDLKVPCHLTRDGPTMPSPEEGHSSTAYSGVNTFYNDSAAPQRHQGDIRDIIENLPYPLKNMARGWSNRASELVVQKMLGILQTDIKIMYQCDPSAWRKILEPLCGPKGILCTVERKGPQGGVTSVTCNYNDCTQRFGHNPAETFVRHLVGKHWRIHPFNCERCEYSSSYLQNCIRHQRTCEG